MTKYLFILLVIPLIIGCRKVKPKNLVGDYDCVVKSSSWYLDNDSPFGVYKSDTLFSKVYTVTYEDKYIAFNGKEIHIDSFDTEGSYEETIGHSVKRTLSFRNDSLFSYSSSSGLGSGGTTQIIGVKIN